MSSAFLSRCCVVASVALSLFIGKSFGDEDYTQWTKSSKITINTSPTGYNTTENLANFPYLVRLSAPGFTFSEANDSGADIRFANAAGTHLSYEIELWDSANGTAAIWVKVDTIKGNDSAQFITMYWGKAGAVSASSGPAVFDTANGYNLVCHLGDQNYADATANGFTGTDPTGSSSPNFAGVIGNSQTFSSNYIEYGTSAGSSPSITVSMWIKADDNSGFMRTGGKISDTGANGWEFLVRPKDESNSIIFRMGATEIYGGWGSEDQGDNAYAPGKWSFITATFDAGANEAQFFVKGVVVDSVAVTDGRGVANTDAQMTIGIGPTGAEQFTGSIDEVQISTKVRSADWIKLSYLNQKMPITAPPTIKYSTRDIVVKTGESIDPAAIPDITGEVDSITIFPGSLPDWLSFDAATGMISGYASSVTPKDTFIVKVWNEKGSSADTVYITIADTATTSLKLKTNGSARTDLIGVTRSAQPRVLFSVKSPSALREVSFMLYNLKGSVVWSSVKAASQLSAGPQSISIGRTGKMSTGIYLLEMKAVGTDGRMLLARRIKATL